MIETSFRWKHRHSLFHPLIYDGKFQEFQYEWKMARKDPNYDITKVMLGLEPYFKEWESQLLGYSPVPSISFQTIISLISYAGKDWREELNKWILEVDEECILSELREIAIYILRKSNCVKAYMKIKPWSSAFLFNEVFKRKLFDRILKKRATQRHHLYMPYVNNMYYLFQKEIDYFAIDHSELSEYHWWLLYLWSSDPLEGDLIYYLNLNRTKIKLRRHELWNQIDQSPLIHLINRPLSLRRSRNQSTRNHS